MKKSRGNRKKSRTSNRYRNRTKKSMKDSTGGSTNNKRKRADTATPISIDLEQTNIKNVFGNFTDFKYLTDVQIVDAQRSASKTDSVFLRFAI